MTVQIPSTPTRRVWSADEKRAHVMAYSECAERGAKTEYLRQHNLKDYHIARWSRAMKNGDLDANLIPREGARLDKKDIAEVKRITQENRKLVKRVKELEAELVRANQRADQYQEQSVANSRAVESLGKAIAAMQGLSER